MNLLQQIEQEHAAQLSEGRTISDCEVGDTVRVSVRVVEGTRERTQVYEGVVMERRGSGIRENFTVRRISFGEGVERNFPLNSPTVQKIETVRSGKVRRAKLTYLRKQTGKQSRIEEERTKTDTGSAPAV